MDRHLKIEPRKDRVAESSLLRSLFPALILFLLSAGARAGTVEMRDITVTPIGGRATITFLVDGPVETVVLEQRGINGVQIRMKSITATEKGLTSALPKPGLLSITAHIERTDVLVTDALFLREVIDIAVLRRDGEQVIVGVQLGRILTAAERQGYGISTVVIDPGHGGSDPGATGLGGEEEKDITLAVALAVEAEMKRRMPGVKVILTRRTDTYVDLFTRGELANNAEADLFVSIHCNATELKPTPAQGFECWVWRPDALTDGGTNQESSSGGPPDPESTALPGTKRSRALASALRGALRGGTILKDRGTHQAGFYVLVGTVMPAVLVELGYLTNRDDLTYLVSSAGQKRVAAALVAGIRAYGLKHPSD